MTKGKTYGKEWIASDTQGTDFKGFALEYITEGLRAGGYTILTTRMVDYNEDHHWLLQCESIDPHTHIFVKWSDPDDQRPNLL